jgi:hypothetical protein
MPGFEPAWWCRGPHAQTLWPNLVRRRPEITLRRERLNLPDGDFLDLDWTLNDDGPIVVILHGLEGSSRSQYIRGLLKTLKAQGWRGVVLHFRGCSGEPNRLARGYHSGETSDLAWVIDHLRRREPNTPIAAVGYSLGGNVLLKWLGERGAGAPLQAAVAVSVPFVLQEAADRFCRSFSRLYQWALLRSLKRGYQRKFARMPSPLSVDPARLNRFWDFDHHVTAPLHGFESADHYYRIASSRQYLRGIGVPTLIVHAADDPFMSPAAVPRADEIADAIDFELYSGGGHVGFVSGTWPWRPRYWLEERIPAFLQGRLGAK